MNKTFFILMTPLFFNLSAHASSSPNDRLECTSEFSIYSKSLQKKQNDECMRQRRMCAPTGIRTVAGPSFRSTFEAGHSENEVNYYHVNGELMIPDIAETTFSGFIARGGFDSGEPESGVREVGISIEKASFGAESGSLFVMRPGRGLGNPYLHSGDEILASIHNPQGVRMKKADEQLRDVELRCTLVLE